MPAIFLILNPAGIKAKAAQAATGNPVLGSSLVCTPATCAVTTLGADAADTCLKVRAGAGAGAGLLTVTVVGLLLVMFIGGVFTVVGLVTVIGPGLTVTS